MHDVVGIAVKQDCEYTKAYGDFERETGLLGRANYAWMS